VSARGGKAFAKGKGKGKLIVYVYCLLNKLSPSVPYMNNRKPEVKRPANATTNGDLRDEEKIANKCET
jgi:hypothetical protein